jgi:hypothetical protein
VLERTLRTSFALRALAAIRRRAGLDADLAELAARVERLERTVATHPGVPQFFAQGSTKAWASPRDADLLEEVLGTLAERSGGVLEVLEWGSGLSTLHYPDWLARRGVRVSWTTLEYDREFFRTFLEPGLLQRDARVVWSEELASRGDALTDRAGVTAVVFDEGRIDPIEGSARAADRLRDLDDYVALPGTLGRRFHAVLVDGRKRRRCLREAAKLLDDDGVALLHDAQRPYYHCAFAAFRSGRRIGDELWIGAQAVTDFADLVPREALGESTRDQVSAKRVGASSASSEPA